MDEQTAGLQLRFWTDESLVCGLRTVGRRILAYGRFIIAIAGVLAVASAFAGMIVLAVSVLIRDDDRTHHLSVVDPMFLVAQELTIGMPPSGKTSRLPALASRDRLTADAILAAYLRTLAPSATPQNSAPPLSVAANIEDRGGTAGPIAALLTGRDVLNQDIYAEPPQSSESSSLSGTDNASAPNEPRQLTAEVNRGAVADATAPVDRQFALPEAKPHSDRRDSAIVDQRKPSAPAEKSKNAPQAGDQLADLSGHDLTVGRSGEPLSRRTGPEASVGPGFPWPVRSNRVAIYDISAGAVYLPDGERLEAHSGVGRMRDNPSFAKVKMLGPTPPATYALSLRGEAFHGVDAIRLTPLNGTAPFGRDGLLAHTYMLRRPGDSNGCVVFANYNRFLKAFRNNEVNYMVVVPQMQDRLTELKSIPARG